MSLLKCKCCGGDLNIKDGDKVVTCPYCGSQQTIPNEKDEQVLKIYARGNRLRSQGEFDKAYSTYSQLLNEGKENAEVYWNLLLCKYGITYVDDYDGKKKPTMNRRSMTSILDDDDYKKAIELSDSVSKEVYEQEANRINDIQQGILKIVHQEEPYDVFISYKETDEFGDRTKDSLLAQEIYDALTKDGYRVFLSRVTLSNVIGKEYEPYIYSALYTAKLMLLVTTEGEHVNSIWVKNEWSRFVDRRKTDSSKSLIPCYRDRDPYDLPKELRNLQGLDRSKLGFIQDLTRGVKKILGKKEGSHKGYEGQKSENEAKEAKYNSRLDQCKQLLESEKYDELKNVLDELDKTEYVRFLIYDWKFYYYSVQYKLHRQKKPVSLDDGDYSDFLEKCDIAKIKSDVEKSVYTGWTNYYCSKCNELSKKIKAVIEPGYQIRSQDINEWHTDARELHDIIDKMYWPIRCQFSESDVYQNLFYSMDKSLPFRPDGDMKEPYEFDSTGTDFLIYDVHGLFGGRYNYDCGYNESEIKSIGDINIVSISAIYIEQKQVIIVADKTYIIHCDKPIDDESVIVYRLQRTTALFHSLKQKIFDYYFLDGNQVFDYQGHRLDPEEAKKVQEKVDSLKQQELSVKQADETLLPKAEKLNLNDDGQKNQTKLEENTQSGQTNEDIERTKQELFRRQRKMEREKANKIKSLENGILAFKILSIICSVAAIIAFICFLTIRANRGDGVLALALGVAFISLGLYFVLFMAFFKKLIGKLK